MYGQSRTLLAGVVLALAASAASAQNPAVTLRLGAVDGKASPGKHCCANTGGGNFDVRQTSPDTVVITMTGTAVSGLCGPAQFDFDLTQCFTVVFERPDVQSATLNLQGRVIGLLRSPGKGEAGYTDASVAVTCDGPEGTEVVSLCVPAQAIACKDHLSIYRKEGPVCVPIAPGCYTLRQTFSIWAKGGLKSSSAEFAPGALNPAWISYKEPFYGAAKKDFGFQIILKVAPGTGTPPAVQKIDRAEPKTAEGGL